jgi:hypothetical protein
MTEKAQSTIPSKKSLPKTPVQQQKSAENMGIQANTPSGLAEKLKISLLALEGLQMRLDDQYAIIWTTNTRWEQENYVLQYRNGKEISRTLLPAMYDYRGAGWSPTNQLAITLIRANQESPYTWDDKLTVPGRNITLFQIELQVIATKIATHCNSRENLRALSEYCRVDGKHGVYNVVSPKNAFQSIIFPRLWNTLELNGINRIAGLVEDAPGTASPSSLEEKQNKVKELLQESIALTRSLQNLDATIKNSAQEYQTAQSQWASPNNK